MTEAPLISTVIPVFNCEKYLGAAIESILAQNYQPIQIIVVDDGSTDGSAAVAFPAGACAWPLCRHARVPPVRLPNARHPASSSGETETTSRRPSLNSSASLERCGS